MIFRGYKRVFKFISQHFFYVGVVLLLCACGLLGLVLSEIVCTHLLLGHKKLSFHLFSMDESKLAPSRSIALFRNGFVQKIAWGEIACNEC